MWATHETNGTWFRLRTKKNWHCSRPNQYRIFGRDWGYTSRHTRDWQPDVLVVGSPLAFDGSEPQFARYARDFGKQLHTRFKLPVDFIDEKLTTESADAIIRETTAPNKQIKKRRKNIRDQLAAELILQTYLNENNTPQTR